MLVAASTTRCSSDAPRSRPAFPFVGTIVYLIVRPPEYLDDVRLRELEMTAAEARLADLDYRLCPHCDYEIKADFLRCPNCMRKLKERCYSCGKPIEENWKICPYCEAETESAPARRPPSPPGDRRATSQPRPEPEPTIAGRKRTGDRHAVRWTGH